MPSRRERKTKKLWAKDGLSPTMLTCACGAVGQFKLANQATTSGSPPFGICGACSYLEPRSPEEKARRAAVRSRQSRRAYLLRHPNARLNSTAATRAAAGRPVR